MVEFTEQKKAQVNDMKNNSARSALLILLAGALWGTMGIFVRRFNSFGFDAMQVASMRLTAGAVIFIIALALRGGKGFKIAARDIPLFLEKPVCISEAQYRTLREAAEGKLDRAVVSLPLRVADITVRLRQLVESGALGRVTMAQAVNNVPYGSVYYHSWYRDPSLTGGLFLQKTTHDIDYICHAAGLTPKRVFAHTEKLYYKGDRPAGLHCPDCPDYRTCVESSYVVGKLRGEDVQGDCCCFAVDTGNEDVASAMFLCESGAIISYNQHFTVKRTAARRGCRIIGTKGSAEFDFYTGVIRHDDYAFDQTATIQIRPTGGNHFGGDRRLAQDFMNLLAGGTPSSDLLGGLRSAACCLAAKRSAETNCLTDILL